jgi:mannose-1-phosphate guanylyltransferase
MKAVVLCGGKGERLRPITFETHKSMIPIYGYPLLTHVLNKYQEYGINDFEIITGVEGYQPISRRFNGCRVWLEKDKLDTGGWLNTVLPPQIEREGDVFVNNGDNLLDIKFNEFLSAHRSRRDIITIACVKVKDISQYGTVHIKDRRIKEFIEKQKSRKRQSGWISSGYYVFNMPKLLDFLEETGLYKKKVLSLERDVFPALAKEGKLGAYKTTSKWFDTGTVDRYSEVIHKWKIVPKPFVLKPLR